MVYSGTGKRARLISVLTQFGPPPHGDGPDCYRVQLFAVAIGTLRTTGAFLGVWVTGARTPPVCCCCAPPAGVFRLTVIVPPLQVTVFPSTNTDWPSSIGMS